MNDELIFRDYNLLSKHVPSLPKALPGFVSHAISNLPPHMREAGTSSMFPVAAAQVQGETTFLYITRVFHEPCCSMQVTSADSAVGKSSLDNMHDAMSRHLTEHDVDARRQLAAWANACRTKGASKDKPQRPQVSILRPMPDMTKPAFINILDMAERDGKKSVYVDMPELDLLDDTCGGHRKVGKAILQNFDTKKFGQERFTADGLTADPVMRWKWTASCIPEGARSFFRGGLKNGIVGRIDFAYVARPADRNVPVEGEYNEKWMTKMDEYLVRLQNASGQYSIPQLNKLMLKLDQELKEISDLADDPLMESLSHRVLRIAHSKGALLWITDGFRWSKRIEDFLVWSVAYSLWSIYKIFLPSISNLASKQKPETSELRKYGPRNMLDMLTGKSFSKSQLETLRSSVNKSVEGSSDQLKTWCQRGFITYDSATQLYTKTAEYLAKHPVQNDGDGQKD